MALGLEILAVRAHNSDQSDYLRWVMHTWQLQEAKSRFSELVDLSLKEGPQLVTRHGHEAVVVLAAADYRRLSGEAPQLMACLLDAPRGPALDIARSSEPIRDISV